MNTEDRPVKRRKNTLSAVNQHRLNMELERFKDEYKALTREGALAKAKAALDFEITDLNMVSAGKVVGISWKRPAGRSAYLRVKALEEALASLTENVKALYKRVEVLEGMMDKHENDLVGALDLVQKCSMREI